MREFLIAGSFPLTILAILVGCAAGICYLNAKQNGGKLAQEDARFAWGCLIQIGLCIFCLTFYYGLMKIQDTPLPRYIFEREERMLGAVVILVVLGMLFVLKGRLYLQRWKLYRKLRYIHHWHFGRDARRRLSVPSWAKPDKKKGS